MLTLGWGDKEIRKGDG